MMERYSIVEFISEREGYKCGYCKGKNSNYSQGMWSHALDVKDYKALMDRGWRRSGRYCYKPTMNKTCCPQYTIRCNASEFEPSKSHKRVLKRFLAYLKTGKSRGESLKQQEEEEEEEGDEEGRRTFKKKDDNENDGQMEVELLKRMEGKYKEKRVTSVSIGPDPTKPKARKAKEIRIEKRLEKQNNKQPSSSSAPRKKNLEDFLNEIPPSSSNPKHLYKTRLIKASTENPEFKQSLNESYAVYKKYQMMIHQDPSSECTEGQFIRFLCNSSLMCSDEKYGAYHQQYLIDDKIAFVGVIDVLPNSISSVYLYYDPDYAFLSPGTLSSLLEIGSMRSHFYHDKDELAYYYMGFYIHSCSKMRYKAQYKPSMLACPETYSWFPIEDCILKLDVAKYSRLNPNTHAIDSDLSSCIDDILVLCDGQVAPYALYLRHFKAGSRNPEMDALQYTKLVGISLAKKMLLYRET